MLPVSGKNSIGEGGVEDERKRSGYREGNVLSIVAVIESEPKDLSEGMQERRLAMSDVQVRFGGQGKGGVEGG